MTKIELQGNYHYTPPYIFCTSNNIRLLVGVRKLKTFQKTPLYLTYKPLSTTEAPQYISSLYIATSKEIGDVIIETYKFDFQGVRYSFIDNGTSIQIAKI
jgi:hypothetical protein